MKSLDMLLQAVKREVCGPMRQSVLLLLTDAALEQAKAERDSRAFIDSKKRGVPKASKPSLQNT